MYKSRTKKKKNNNNNSLSQQLKWKAVLATGRKDLIQQEKEKERGLLDTPQAFQTVKRFIG